MILTIIAAMAMAKIKHFKIKYLFLSWTFYPILILEGIITFFQIYVFLGDYTYTQYAHTFKIIYQFAYLIPVFVFGLYKPAFIGSCSIFLGTLMNKFVIAQNNGKMPVYPSLSYLTGYMKPDTFQQAQDGIHILGNTQVHWKFLSDYIDVGFTILSPGDILIYFFSFLIIYETIKTLNLRHASKNLTSIKNKDGLDEANIN